MKHRSLKGFWFVLFVFLWGGFAPFVSGDINPDPPTYPVKLIFIHHSCGENLLADYDGDLGLALRDNNYFVSDTNYGWGPDGIGNSTDIGHWWLWFRGPNSTTYLNALYAEGKRHSDYSRLKQNPGGPNEIILFKSCFPNSHLEGNPDDPPPSGNNPLRGEDCGSNHHSVANAKGIYNDLLSYFATRQDKLFIVITAPPLSGNSTDAHHAASARAFNNWLVDEWLQNYAYHNVAVFDFYNVLTSNGGDQNTNDVNMPSGNHHRWWNGAVQHIQTVKRNTSAYPQDPWDSHPTAAGNRKTTLELIPLLNIYYNCWKGTGDCPDATSSNLAPIIDSFTADISSGRMPLTVNFTCLAHDPDGAITEFLWDFDGNGQTDMITSQGLSSYTFQTPGSFQVSCIVKDNSSATVQSPAITITVTCTKGVHIRR
jgi:PKD repeat protein